MGKERSQREFYLAIVLVLGVIFISSYIDSSVTGQTFSLRSWFGIPKSISEGVGCECPLDNPDFNPCGNQKYLGVCHSGTCSRTWHEQDKDGEWVVEREVRECYENSKKKRCAQSCHPIEGVKGSTKGRTMPATLGGRYWTSSSGCPATSQACNGEQCTFTVYENRERTSVYDTFPGHCKVLNYN